MHRSNKKKIITFEQNEEDPRIKSKCTTPKRFGDFNNKNQAYFPQTNSYEKTQQKPIRYRSRINPQVGESLQKHLQKTIESYDVVSGTLKQYLRQQRVKQKDTNKSLRTTIQIIKAFAKTQITQISPNVSVLITNILNTLKFEKVSIKKSNSNKKSTTKIKNKSKSEEMKSKQYSFAKQKEWKMQQQIQENNLRSQIEQLEENLESLKIQGQALQQIKSQFEEMGENERKQYIWELEEIITKQQRILEEIEDQY